MTPHDSAYAALGLRPGAGRAQVDEAYRRLIKLHHPDRTGGNSARAAEINRAYTLLRRDGLAAGPQVRPVPVTIQPALRRARPARSNWLFNIALVVIVAGGIATMEMSTRGRFGYPLEMRLPAADAIPAMTQQMPLESFDEPLHSPVINSAIVEAVKLHSAGDSVAADVYSRDCQNTLRQERSLVWFDACSAFDEATLTLSTDEELGDPGGFKGSQIAAREMAAARMLSDDVLGADLRVHQIRSQVELQLVPMLDSAASQKP
jgi:hypothetical protein